MTQHTDDVRYIASLTERVRAGDPCAMLSLANCYFYGIRGVARDNDQGVLLLQQAVAGGDRNAMLKLATCFSTGEGMPKDLDKAQHWYLTARDARGLHDVGHDYYYGDGKGPTRRDVDKAVSAWAKAVDLGDDRAMGQLGWCYQHGVGVECDKHRAVSLYNDAIAKNKSNSWRLGVCYLRGEGVERDWARAVQLFQQSGGSGDAKAYLGWCYLWGCGAERDVAKAVAMLQSAAASSAKAMVFLGYCLERGIGAAKDPGRADALYDRAKFRVWDAEALGELGLYCQKGDCGAPMDRRAAVGYFLMGAQRGDPVSMFHLGDCDLEQSCHWLEKATQLGHMQASKILSALSFHNAKSLGDCEEAQEEVSNDALIHQVESLKAHIGALQNENRQLASRINNSVAADDTSLKKQIAELKKEKEELQKEKERLLHHVEDTEAALYQEQTAGVTLRDLVGEVERYKIIVNTMTSLISATPSDFGVEKLLGTGSNAAAFKVQYRTTTINSAYHNQGSSALASTFKASPGAIKTTTDMVMKVLFNWENTPQQTMLRQKYMAECVALSLVPTHPNVIHPLGALVIPRLPTEFVEKIPSDKPVYRQLCHNKSLAILMPHCGIRLSSFIPLSSGSNQKTVEIAHNLIIQGLKAIHHIESHFIVHRDIKEDNILVDTESGKLTLIDFGEAQHCPNSNMEIAVTATTETWGNLGTIPPELSIFLKRITRGTSGVFSYLKCDSFALALTFWDALLPQSNKFIGSTLNGDMSAFNTQSLLSHFPVPCFSSAAPPQQQEPTSVVRPKSFLARAWSSLGWFPEPEPTVPIQSTMTTATTLGDDNQNNDIVRNTVSSLSSVLIGMMNPDKAARFSASEAISSLTNDKL